MYVQDHLYTDYKCYSWQQAQVLPNQTLLQRFMDPLPDQYLTWAYQIDLNKMLSMAQRGNDTAPQSLAWSSITRGQLAGWRGTDRTGCTFPNPGSNHLSQSLSLRVFTDPVCIWTALTAALHHHPACGQTAVDTISCSTLGTTLAALKRQIGWS